MKDLKKKGQDQKKFHNKVTAQEKEMAKLDQQMLAVKAVLQTQLKLNDDLENFIH